MDFMTFLGVGFYYLFFLVGSVTIGYFVLRVSYPEVRVYDANRKLVVSGMLGLIIVFLSYITNLFFFGVDRFLNVDSYIEVFTVFYAVIFFIVFKYYYSFTPKFITVAVPVREEVKKPVKRGGKTFVEKQPSLEELKKEITGGEVELNIPLKTERFESEGVEGLKKEILGAAPKSIEVPLKEETLVKKSSQQAKIEKHAEVKQVEKQGVEVKKTENEFYAPFRPKPELFEEKQKTLAPPTQPQPQVKGEGFRFQKTKEKPKTENESEIEEILKDVVRETVEEARGKEVPKHRRYLLSPEQKEKVKVIASSDIAGKEEFQALVQDVYEQLRKTKTAGSVQKITPNVPTEPLKKVEEKKEEKKEENKEGVREEKKTGREERKTEREKRKEQKPVEELSLSDVLGGEVVKKEEKPTGLFAELSGITEGGGEVKTQKSSEFVKIESENGMGCPNCHAKNTRIVFCPYCGGAMCTNCSPQIRIEGDKFIFTCPHCGEDVYVKRLKENPKNN